MLYGVVLLLAVVRVVSPAVMVLWVMSLCVIAVVAVVAVVVSAVVAGSLGRSLAIISALRGLL